MRQLCDTPDAQLWVFWHSAYDTTVDCNGYLVRTHGQNIVVNPPGLADEDLVTFDHLGAPASIVVTDAGRLAGAEPFLARYRAQLVRADQGDSLPNGWESIVLPTPKSQPEVALLDRAQRRLFVGSSFQATPPGRLSAAAGVSSEHHRQNAGALSEFPIELLLPAFGFVIQRNGISAVRAAALRSAAPA
jgi:hypothetical protein